MGGQRFSSLANVLLSMLGRDGLHDTFMHTSLSYSCLILSESITILVIFMKGTMGDIRRFMNEMNRSLIKCRRMIKHTRMNKITAMQACRTRLEEKRRERRKEMQDTKSGHWIHWN